ncbi:MAG: PDZ domain-containing protein, partial [Polyangiaceae bacterium]|nr:PDZ domain-containing protein [Polyangiaceae bacterium]
MKRSRWMLGASLLACLTCSSSVLAGDFDPWGSFAFDPGAEFTEGLEAFPSWDPASGGEPGSVEGLVVEASDEALEGLRVGRLAPLSYYGAVRVPLAVPTSAGSYRVQMWTRSGTITAVAVVNYRSRPEGRVLFDLSETGRCTSDGWVELASAPFSVDGSDVEQAYVSMRGYAQVDGFELVPSGQYAEATTCYGVLDSACGSDAVCLDGICRDGAAFVPHLPAASERGRVVDLLETRLRYFFGGRATRRHYLPRALAQIDRMRTATTPWTFWNGFATAVRELHDWHSSASGLIDSMRERWAMNVCFIEGDANLSQPVWPSDPRHLDVLVSHVGSAGSAGLRPGDRLVAVDGIHPITWARSLIGSAWSFWQADDDTVNAEFVERLRGLIPKYARTFTVIHCDSGTDACNSTPEIVLVSSLPLADDVSDAMVQCDNRPAYHLVNGPDASTHDLGWSLFKGLLVDSQPGENLYGITWDSLWGPSVSPVFKATNQQFAQHARGVILDHRAGNGGTIDAPETLTQLVRDRFEMSLFIYDRPSAGFEGPIDEAQGQAIFNKYKTYTQSPDLTYTVGGSSPALDLPVALLIHRDGSASDYLPFGMRGA